MTNNSLTNVSPAQVEAALGETLGAARERFQHALAETGDAPSTFTAFDTKLHVDQFRRIVASGMVGSDLWSIREGKRLLSVSTEPRRALLSIYMGRGRFLAVGTLLSLLCDTVARKSIRAGETSVAIICNLVVVEPCLYPERELPIWLAIAHSTRLDDHSEDIHRMMPELSTDYDPLYREVPATTRFGKLLQPPEIPRDPLPVFKIRMLRATRPDLTQTIDAMQTDEERDLLFASLEPELREYIRQHLHQRIADAINAAGGRYAEILPVEKA